MKFICYVLSICAKESEWCKQYSIQRTGSYKFCSIFILRNVWNLKKNNFQGLFVFFCLDFDRHVNWRMEGRSKSFLVLKCLYFKNKKIRWFLNISKMQRLKKNRFVIWKHLNWNLPEIFLLICCTFELSFSLKRSLMKNIAKSSKFSDESWKNLHFFTPN